MRHLSDGALRRLHDDRFAVSNREREHLAGCDRCRRRAERVSADAANATLLFAAPIGEPSATEAALGRFRERVASGAADRGNVLVTPPRRVARRWAIGAVAIPAVVAGLVVSANAAGWLSIFSPTKVAPITLTIGDLKALPDLSAYGQMTISKLNPRQVADGAAAATATGLQPLRATLPANVPAAVTWEVVDQGSATFTLDAATAAAAAARAGHAAPRIPAALNGTSVTVDAGPAMVAVYGAPPAGSTDQLAANLPTLVIAEGVRPTASTNGATLKQLEDFLVAQPGVSQQLAAEVLAIGDPASTLPIPVITGVTTSQTISIDGVQGVLTGDSTGLGSALIWEKAGVVYAVGGLLPQSEVVDIARSLH
ncbi:MAG TPA: hypothetical protein VIN65_00590 [Candidatus Dormibacteraeota bacterium]